MSIYVVLLLFHQFNVYFNDYKLTDNNIYFAHNVCLLDGLMDIQMAECGWLKCTRLIDRFYKCNIHSCSYTKL